MSIINYNSASALRDFLESEGLGMRKKFGQNFLINPSVRQSLVDALGARSGDEVWEVGPGLGAMTSLLLERGFSVKAFEIDPGFIGVLKKIFYDEKNFTLVEGDVMKTWSAQEPSPFFLGNLPYNVGAALLADLIEKGRLFTRMVVTVQKEGPSSRRDPAPLPRPHPQSSRQVSPQAHALQRGLSKNSDRIFSSSPTLHSQEKRVRRRRNYNLLYFLTSCFKRLKAK